MLEIQQYQYAGTGAAPLLVVDGDEVIAHVYRPEYAPVFCAAPQMFDLLHVLSESMPEHMKAEYSETMDEARLVLMGVQIQQSELENTEDATVTIMDGIDLIAYLHQPAYAPVLAAGFKMLELLQQLTNTADTSHVDPVTSRAVLQARDLELALRVQQSTVAHTRGATIH